MSTNPIDRFMEKQRERVVREHLLTDEFIDMIHENASPYNQLIAYYRCAIMEVETKFKVLNEQFSLQYDRNPIETIKARIKSPESLLRKIKNKNIPFTLSAIEENINDIAGLRIVCSFPEDIYMLEDCLLRQDDITLLQRKDYIQNPKESGYRSLHLIVQIPIFLQNEKKDMKVEVQLRTIAMDFWASLEHKLRYKKNIPESEVKELATRLFQCAEMSAQLDSTMQDIRNHIARFEGEEASKNPLFWGDLKNRH